MIQVNWEPIKWFWTKLLKWTECIFRLLILCVFKRYLCNKCLQTEIRAAWWWPLSEWIALRHGWIGTRQKRGWGSGWTCRQATKTSWRSRPLRPTPKWSSRCKGDACDRLARRRRPGARCPSPASGRARSLAASPRAGSWSMPIPAGSAWSLGPVRERNAGYTQYA